MKNIFDYNLDELKEVMKEHKQPAFRAKQVVDWLYKGCSTYDDMKNIPKATKEVLEKELYIGLPDIVQRLESKDGTIKYLFKLYDDNIIEAVVMKYKHGNTICISTQIGCRMGCAFCASTVGGRVRDLTSGEMIGQIMKASEDIGDRISNVVLMGSGEPLDNYESVVKFLRQANSKEGLNIGARHMTLSTCGLVPKMRDLADEGLQVTLAISLHAPNDNMRKETMPIANKYTIKELLEACEYYIDKVNRRVTFEYALIKGKNDSIECAKELGSLLKGMLCHVNLIPVNDVSENNFKKSSPQAIKEFKEILDSFGVETTVRREMGSDINAACGQLRQNYIKSERE